MSTLSISSRTLVDGSLKSILKVTDQDDLPWKEVFEVDQNGLYLDVTITSSVTAKSECIVEASDLTELNIRIDAILATLSARANAFRTLPPTTERIHNF